VVHKSSIEFRGADDGRIAADIYSAASKDADVALLLHGGGQTRHAWRSTARRLCESGITAIAYDQRGHGESDWSPLGEYAFEDYARDLARVADSVAERFGRRPIEIGASLGGIAGMLAQGTAERPMLAALVLVDVTPYLDPEGAAKVSGFMGAHLHEGFANVEEAAEAVAAYLPHRPRPRSLDGLKRNLRQRPDGRWRWHWDPRFIETARQPETVTGRLVSAASRLTIPTLLVRGGSSELIQEQQVDKFRALVPHASVVNVPGAGHMVAGDKNDVFSDAVLDFVTGLQGSSTFSNNR
jgi:pimeloyl-ACP methyl ester carboxylesterase